MPFEDFEIGSAPRAFDGNLHCVRLAPEAADRCAGQFRGQPREPRVAALRIPHDQDAPCAHPASLRWTSFVATIVADEVLTASRSFVEENDPLGSAKRARTARS